MPGNNRCFLENLDFQDFEHVEYFRLHFQDFYNYILKSWLYFPKPNRRVSQLRFVWRAGQLPIFYFNPVRDKHAKWNNMQECAKTQNISNTEFLGEEDGDGDGDDGRIFTVHRSPILHEPRDNISRKGNPSLR